MDDGRGPQAVGDLGPMEGRLVEICGLEVPIEPSPSSKSADAGISSIDANGLRGRVIGWDQADCKYVVETFDGVLIGVKEENLQNFEPPAPEEGGFDVAWPSGPESPEVFAEAVVSCLAEKGYCLIQMFTSAKIRKAASEETRDLDDWRLPTKELEVPYLGYDNSTKYANLPDDSLDREPQDALSRCDRTLTNLGLFVTPTLESLLGFRIWGRRSGMVRVPLGGSTEESLLRPRGLEDDDYDPGGKVYGHINFLERRKLQVMYMVQNGGGNVWLYPNANLGTDMRNVKLPITENKLLVVLPEIMSYSYKPRGENLLLQTWYVSPPFVADPQDARIVTLPDLHQGKRTMVMSLAFRYAGSVEGPDQGRLMWLAGSDGAVKIPSSRFDVDLYYSPELHAAPLYVNHAGCMGDEVMMGLDNEFFGLSQEEASIMDPSQRNVLEVGYEALHEAGYRRACLRGLACGIYLGNAGTDWLATAAHMAGEQGAQGATTPHISTGINGGVTGSRLSHIMGMRGPCVTVDTACSSSLVSFGQAHHSLQDTAFGRRAVTADARIKRALVMGTCMMNGLSTFFAYCAAQMLSISGRSLTFDEGANGFVRAEGCSAALVQIGDGEEDAQLMRACGVGCNVNQDGRSASMTAPNGPSQSACIRNSMSQAGLSPNNITIAECHGTGTALGDPIEVGALREIMKDRDDPMVVTSTKTNFGHMEACAGIGGISKCILMLSGSVGTPNLHLKCINAHIEFTGYPALFVVEPQDTHIRTGISGVSSFGVGGTNARADLWGRSVVGHLSTTEVNTFHALRLRSAQYARIKHEGAPGPHAGDRLSVVGSWDAWSDAVEMEALAEGEYAATVALGGSRCERFRILLNGDRRQSIYPATELADDSQDICGPDWDAGDKAWLLDGRGDGTAVAGAVYRIKLEWGFSWDLGEHKRVTWERVEDEAEAEPPQVDCRAFHRKYYVAGSWTAGKCKQMEQSPDDDGVYRASVRVGLTGQEWFQILGDKDKAQVYHPAIAGAIRTNVPVRGPDNQGEGKYWVIQGSTGEHVAIEFQINDGLAKVTLKSPIQGSKSWTSEDRDDWHEFALLRPKRDWDLERLHPVDGASGQHRCSIMIGDKGIEDFQLVVDRDMGQVLYPHRGGAGLGEGAICGPDAEGAGLHWRIIGRPGHLYEILLDLNQEDALQMVSWQRISVQPELEDS
mmetsp:Transcript_141894/g.441134  ORF Transcript_141894/g.441134 Transcript_141894/m.441134 type:complete len:1193 (-) Transcript_141894:145-3723(-)